MQSKSKMENQIITDISNPAGLERGRNQRPDHQALRMVRCSSPHGVLQARESKAEGSGSICNADQANDPGRNLVRLSDCCQPSSLQQEHGSARVPADELAGAQESRWESSLHLCAAVGGYHIERTLGDGSVPRLGRS